MSPPSGFDPRALAATYAAAGELPDALLRRLFQVRAGTLAHRADLLRELRAQLVAGERPALPEALFGAEIAERGKPALDLLAGGPPPGTSREPVVDELLGELLDATAEATPDEDTLRALRASLEANAQLSDRHLDDDQIARATSELREQRADEAMAERVPRWVERARVWGAVRAVYGGVGDALGLGWDLGTATLKHVGFLQIPALQALLQRSPELAAVVRALGRLAVAADTKREATTRQVHAALRRPVERGAAADRRIPAETRGIERSDVLSRMLPAESALLLNPVSRRLFHARRAEHALSTYRVEGVGVTPRGEPSPQAPPRGSAPRTSPRDRGPIVVLLDTSASMSGAPESVAKAVVLEAMRVAHDERRACFLVAFGGPGEIVELGLSLDREGLPKLLDFLALSFHGGTDTAEPLRRALGRLAREETKDADLLLVSDGVFPYPDELEGPLAEARARGTRLHGLLVGLTESSAMSRLCDPLHRFDAWKLLLPPGARPRTLENRPRSRAPERYARVFMRSRRLLPLASLSMLLAIACGPDPPTTATPGLGEPPTTGGSGGSKFDPGPSPGAGNNGTGANGYGSNGSGASGPGPQAGSSGDAGSGAGGEGGTGVVEPPPGPPQCDTSLRRCPSPITYTNAAAKIVEVRGDFAPGAWEKGVPLKQVGGVWQGSIDVPWDKEVLYKLYVDGQYLQDPANPNGKDDGFGGKNSVLTPLTCEEWTCDDPPALGTFDWRDSVLYFVFVDRFEDGDPSNNGQNVSGVQPPADYRGGDWAGVTKRIEEGYFNGLGVNTLWLSVPMDNPDVLGVGDDGRNYSAYHAYWPSDLTKTEARFGTKAELKALVDAAHAKQLKVVLDYAMNHVHESSPTYQQHKDWFWPNQNGDKNCVCGEGCSWDDAEQARRCWFRDYLPDFNFKVDAARAYSVDNAITWIKDTGIDGFRLDAVKHIEAQWLKDLRTRVKAEIESVSGEHFYTVGETFTGDKGVIKSYVDPDTMLDGQFDFPLRMEMARTVLMRKGSMKDLAGFLAGNDGYYGSGIMSTFIGNHDIPRAIHLAQDTPLWDDQWASGKDKAWDNTPGLPGGTSAFERFANAYTLLFTMKGVPLVYYGDEIGMPGGGDPDNRRLMQWDNYSDGQKLLLAHLKKLTKIRADHPALRRGTRKALGTSDDVLSYQMSTSGDELIIAVNRSDGDKAAEGVPAGSYDDLLTGETVTGPSPNVKARSARVLVAK